MGLLKRHLQHKLTTATDNRKLVHKLRREPLNQQLPAPYKCLIYMTSNETDTPQQTIDKK